jgi:preprotein translocase subunit SecD
MAPVRIFLAALAVLVAVAGCSVQVPGSAQPSGNGFVVKDGTQLRFRPVLTELEPSPPTGSVSDRQSPLPASQQAAAAALDCVQGSPDPLAGRDDPALPLVSCDRAKGTKYVLGPAFLSGADVGWVDAEVDPQTGRAVIGIRFTAAGTRTWADWTGGNVGKQVAMVLQSRVLTAPQIQSAITGGETQISGQFSLPEARQLAHDIAGG